VKSLAELGRAARTARLRRVAFAALAEYDIEAASIRPLATHFNTIFRIDATDGARYALRINRPGHRTLADIRSELAWLDALRRETDLVVTEPMPMRSGELVATIAAPGIPEPRHCALFRWIDGRGPIRRPTTAIISNLGALLARLHDHADRFSPAPAFTTRQLDQTWPHGRPEALYSECPHDLFTPDRKIVLRECAARVDAALGDLYTDPSGLRFLHADLHLGNVKLTPAGLAVLDFDDSLWCYPVQDAGISLFYLQFNANYPALRDAFIGGYSAIRSWPRSTTGDADTFAAARFLELISAMTNTDDPGLASYLPRTLEIGMPHLITWFNSCSR